MYESLLRCAVGDYCKMTGMGNITVGQGDKFWEWVQKLKIDSNDDLWYVLGTDAIKICICTHTLASILQLDREIADCETHALKF